MKSIFPFLASAVMFASSCSAGMLYEADYAPDSDRGLAAMGESGGEGSTGQGTPGMITAGEWNDLDNWAFWGNLMTPKENQDVEGQEQEQKEADYSKMTEYWGFYTNERVAVSVKDPSGQPLPMAKVVLNSGGKAVWQAVTDIFGRADCWAGIYPDRSKVGLSISINGTIMQGTPEITRWSDTEVKMNNYTVPAQNPAELKADILFIVDATGSMTDEIDFLKADLMDILEKVQGMNTAVKINTGALFYRDEGDTYVTKYSQFTDKISSTISYIGRQSASGGGDYPEAVHTALEVSLQKLSWNPKARTKLAFMLLDAPAHQDHQGVLESLHKSIESYAAQGIKLIPVASSGVDKPTEFMLRYFSIATGGTYVFITNDSQIGNDHIIPTVGEYEVELLNNLLVRLINKYLG